MLSNVYKTVVKESLYPVNIPSREFSRAINLNIKNAKAKNFFIDKDALDLTQVSKSFANRDREKEKKYNKKVSSEDKLYNFEKFLKNDREFKKLLSDLKNLNGNYYLNHKEISWFKDFFSEVGKIDIYSTTSLAELKFFEKKYINALKALNYIILTDTLIGIILEARDNSAKHSEYYLRDYPVDYFKNFLKKLLKYSDENKLNEFISYYKIIEFGGDKFYAYTSTFLSEGNNFRKLINIQNKAYYAEEFLSKIIVKEDLINIITDTKKEILSKISQNPEEKKLNESFLQRLSEIENKFSHECYQI